MKNITEDIIVDAVLKPILFELRDEKYITSQQCRSEFKKHKKHKSDIQETVNMIANHIPGTYATEKLMKGIINRSIEFYLNEVEYYD